jgi:glycolate oxidase FAD binding subunit
MSDTPDTITIDGFGPLSVTRPASVAELCDLVRRCAAEGKAVYPVGGGTMLDYGLPPTKPGLAIDTRALDQVIDYPARDMTITVQAGITIARLCEVTWAEGLALPIDVPDPDRATLGGAIACNVSGPRRYGYGTFRDYVLGITTVNDRGEAVSAGGRVVKNVAGYDLMKLHTGALGTLGVITQVTLKLRPLSEKFGSLVFSCKHGSLAAVLDLLHETETRPALLEFVYHPNTESWGFLVGFESNPEAVRWEEQQLGKGLSARGDIDPPKTDALVRPEPVPRDTSASSEERRLQFRASLRPSGVAPFCDSAVSFSHVQLSGAPGSGIVYGDCFTTLTEARSMIDMLLGAAAKFDGNVVIERCPTEWKKSLPVWGRPPADLALQKAVKRALDPNNLFNPGRFVTDMWPARPVE